MEITILETSQKFEVAVKDKNLDKIKNILFDLSCQTLEKQQAKQLVNDAMVLFEKTPKLLECTYESLLGGFKTALQLNMTLHPSLQFCYLIPYWNDTKRANEAQFQFGYRGLETMVKRAYSGVVVSFDSDVVTQKELDLGSFKIEKGTTPKLTHFLSPNRQIFSDKLVGAYAVCFMGGIAVNVRYLSFADLELLRLRNKSQFDRKTGDTQAKQAWKTDWAAMAQAKALKSLCSKLCTEIQKYDENIISFDANQNKTTIETTYVEIDERMILLDYQDKVQKAMTGGRVRELWEDIQAKHPEIKLQITPIFTLQKIFLSIYKEIQNCPNSVELEVLCTNKISSNPLLTAQIQSAWNERQTELENATK